MDDCGGEYHAESYGDQAQNQADQTKLSESEHVSVLAGIEHRLLDETGADLEHLSAKPTTCLKEAQPAESENGKPGCHDLGRKDRLRAIASTLSVLE